MGELVGGCLCGNIRYRACGDLPSGPCACNCRMCQKASGAPFINWIAVEQEGFTYVKGQPANYRSGPEAVRSFCGSCGSQLTLKYDAEPDTIHVSSGTLDNPNAVPPEKHIWVATQCMWLRLADGRPFHAYGENSHPRGRNVTAVEAVCHPGTDFKHELEE